MAKIYKKPIVSIDTGLSEGVYAASGAKQGTLDVTYIGIWDRWSNGGKGIGQITWSDLSGNVTVNMTFNDSIDQVEVTNYNGTSSISGNTVTLNFDPTANTSPLTVGYHLNHGTSIDNLKMTGFTYSVH